MDYICFISISHVRQFLPDFFTHWQRLHPSPAYFGFGAKALSEPLQRIIFDTHINSAYKMQERYGKFMDKNKDLIDELRNIVMNYDNIVFFGGAGVSTESGIPDFRSVDGLYHQQYDYPPETILSHTFYRRNPGEFFRFYRNKMLFLDAKPNAAHIKLAELEARGKLRAVITQNIDGLHQAAGSRTVLELHGSVLRNYCEKCGQFYDVHYVRNAAGVPECEKCGGSVKPDVVLYEEGLDQKTINAAVRYIHDAQVLIIGGTSLAVYPAAGLII